MVKTNKPVFFKVLLLIIVFLLVETSAMIFIFVPGGISGFSIVNLSEAYSKLYPNSKIFLIVQWAIIAVILLVVYLKNMGIHKRNEEVQDIDLTSAMKNSKTKLDAFYSILKEKKRLNIKTVSDLFEISPDLAMEWARILESSNLVAIDYPGFGSPIIHIIEKAENNLLPEDPVKVER